MTAIAHPARLRAIPATARAVAALLVVSLLGLVGFGWPLLAHPAAGQQR